MIKNQEIKGSLIETNFSFDWWGILVEEGNFK